MAASAKPSAARSTAARTASSAMAPAGASRSPSDGCIGTAGSPRSSGRRYGWAPTSIPTDATLQSLPPRARSVSSVGLADAKPGRPDLSPVQAQCHSADGELQPPLWRCIARCARAAGSTSRRSNNWPPRCGFGEILGSLESRPPTENRSGDDSSSRVSAGKRCDAEGATGSTMAAPVGLAASTARRSKARLAAGRVGRAAALPMARSRQLVEIGRL